MRKLLKMMSLKTRQSWLMAGKPGRKSSSGGVGCWVMMVVVDWSPCQND